MQEDAEEAATTGPLTQQEIAEALWQVLDTHDEGRQCWLRGIRCSDANEAALWWDAGKSSSLQCLMELGQFFYRTHPQAAMRYYEQALEMPAIDWHDNRNYQHLAVQLPILTAATASCAQTPAAAPDASPVAAEAAAATADAPRRKRRPVERFVAEGSASYNKRRKVEKTE